MDKNNRKLKILYKCIKAVPYCSTTFPPSRPICRSYEPEQTDVIFNHSFHQWTLASPPKKTSCSPSTSPQNLFFVFGSFCLVFLFANEIRVWMKNSEASKSRQCTITRLGLWSMGVITGRRETTGCCYNSAGCLRRRLRCVYVWLEVCVLRGKSDTWFKQNLINWNPIQQNKLNIWALNKLSLF